MFNRRLIISEAGGAGGLSVTINVKSGGFIPSNISGAKVYVEGGHLIYRRPGATVMLLGKALRRQM